MLLNRMSASSSNASSSTLDDLSLVLKKCDIAKVKCFTSLDCRSIDFGFTANSLFYPIDVLENVDSVIFSHHEQLLTILCEWPGLEKLKIELKYGCIKGLNFDYSTDQDVCDGSLMTSFIPCPLFYYGEMKRETDFYCYRRFDPQVHDKDGFWQKFIKSTAFLLRFKLSRSTMDSFLSSLSTAGCSVTHNPITLKHFDATKIENFFEKTVKTWPWTFQHCIEAIKSSGTVGSFFLHHVLFEMKQIENVLENGVLNESWATILFTAMFDFISSDIALPLLETFQADNYQSRRHNDSGFVMIKTLFVTPTRKVFCLDDATLDCRGFRKLGVENLLQVKFRDDNLLRFPIDDLLLNQSVRKVCYDGFEVCGRKFYEMGSSSSLFRENGTYFYAAESKEEIVEKWREFGEFNVEPPAKVQARIGLNFTSAREISFKLRQDSYLLIDDLMSDSKDSSGKYYCFSDGCGIISPYFARQIADKLGLSKTPSAFQFRFLGFKGMVAVDVTNPRLAGNGNDEGNYFVLLRPSQKKYEMNKDGLFDFDIVSSSAPAPTRLHGTFIAMIDALAILNGKEKSVRQRLHELQNQTFVDNIKPLIDNQACLETLRKLPKYVPIEEMKTKNVLNQPFFREMIEANSVFNSRLLASKNQIAIPIDLGRAAYGIVDTTGCLKENEVFFQFSKSLKLGKNDAIVKEGRVMITKSPIVYAGDVRFLEAKYYPELKHLVDVIVFPACGSRPHPDKIGGGDLDGDHYTILWDPELLMEKEFEPNDYTTAASTEEMATVDLDKLQLEAPNFRVEYMKRNNLEKLSTAHTAHILLHGPLHADCVKIGKKIDVAVNYFKSGLPAEDLENDERVGRWPMCLNKKHEPAYQNSHILSQLSRRGTTFFHLVSIAQGKAQENREKCDLIKIEDVKIADADIKMFKEYKLELNALMKRYNVKTQGELFSNAIDNVPGTLRNYKDPMGDVGSASALVQRKVFEVFEKFRTKILDRFAPHTWKTDMQNQNKNIFTYKIKAVSPEMIQLAQTFYAMAEEEGQFYSFPWIAWEGLDAWWSAQENQVNSTVKFVREDFDVMFKKFMEANDLSLELLPDAVVKFMHAFEANDANYQKSANQAFFDFLVSCMTCDQSKELYQAAQSTIINFAFFSKNMFDINLRQEIMEYPPFVISIPSDWTKEYEEKVEILVGKSGVEHIDTVVRKSFNNFKHYTLICRGTLDACLKLESILTPVMEPDADKSVKDMKWAKERESRKLLIGIFGFPPIQSNRPARPKQTRKLAPNVNDRRVGNHKNWKNAVEPHLINHRYQNDRFAGNQKNYVRKENKSHHFVREENNRKAAPFRNGGKTVFWNTKYQNSMNLAEFPSHNSFV